MHIETIIERIMQLPDDDRWLLLKVLEWLVSVIECCRLAELRPAATERPSVAGSCPAPGPGAHPTV